MRDPIKAGIMLDRDRNDVSDLYLFSQVSKPHEILTFVPDFEKNGQNV